MRLGLDDVIDVYKTTAAVLEDYYALMSMPNCRTCSKGLDICPKAQEFIRINCANYWNAENGERQKNGENEIRKGDIFITRDGEENGGDEKQGGKDTPDCE